MPEGQRSVKNPQRELDVSRLAEAGVMSPRYEAYGEIASGGMASVQYGRLFGPRGFSRAVAIKRLHAHYSREAEFVNMFLDEARVSARLLHANIIHTLDVIETPGEVALVMEYVHGETLWTLLHLARAQGASIPVGVCCSLIASVLYGLHAAHEACDDLGEPLHIVHRDVSPQNILVGADGVPRILDFGIVKALGRLRSTPSGEIKGKLGYIALEQLHATHVDRRTDVYGAAAVLWELLTGAPLFDGPSEPAIVHRVLYEAVQPPSRIRSEVSAGLDAVILRALSRDADARYATAHEMALALEREVGLVSQAEVASWLAALAGPRLAERSQLLAALQSGSSSQRFRESSGFSETRKIAARPSASGRMSTNALVPARSSKRLKVITVLVLAVFGAIGGWWTAHAWSGYAGRSGSAHWAERDAPAQAVKERSAAQSVAPTPVTEPTVVSQPTGPSAAEKLAAIDKNKPARPVIKRVQREPERPKRAPDKHCAVFYEIDAEGIRQPKPECL